MEWDFKELLTLTFTLFAVIDIIGAVPMLISIKEKMGGLNSAKATFISGGLMILFFFIGKPFLNVLGVDIKSFAVAGSIVIFILGLEMVLGIEFFKPDKDAKAGTVVPIAFPLIAGSGTLTTIMSLKATFERESVRVQRRTLRGFKHHHPRDEMSQRKSIQFLLQTVAGLAAKMSCFFCTARILMSLLFVINDLFLPAFVSLHDQFHRRKFVSIHQVGHQPMNLLVTSPLRIGRAKPRLCESFGRL